MSDEDEEAAVDAALPVSLAQMRDWLRLGGDTEDAVLLRLIGSAQDVCEAFTGQYVMVREARWRGQLSGGRTVTLPVRPVVAVDSVTVRRGQDAPVVLGPSQYHVRIEADGRARVRLDVLFGPIEAEIVYRAGLAALAAAVPEGLRHGMIRMVQHLYESRDVPTLSPHPPASVAGLWQPWRRVTLGGVG